MKIIYKARESRRNNPLPDGNYDTLELLSNDWNDYGYETTFMTTCRIGGERIQLGAIKILFEKPISRRYLKDLLQNGWDGTFPIPNESYISTPSEITFYEQLVGTLSPKEAVKAAKALRDASYLIHVKDDPGAQEMIQGGGFKDSLQRERGAIDAFNNGWKVLDQKSLAARDVDFSFKDVFGERSSLTFKFGAAETSLPRDINVLIGANGTGKSQLLHQMVKAWLADPRQVRSGDFSVPPDISRLIVVSYSPFEQFPVDMDDSKLNDKDAYKYFGLRGVSKSSSPKSKRIGLSRDIPRQDTVASLISCVLDDQRFRHIQGWGRKIATAERVLRAAIKFDAIALKLKSNVNLKDLFEDQDELDAAVSVIKQGGKEGSFITISASNLHHIDAKTLERFVNSEQGVLFLADGAIQQLSSGQRLFTYLVINILGAIKRNTLILIDEPELFLHPSLEIQLVDMLKQILQSFNSRAVLATHSVSTVREIPADCVHVLERTDDSLIIKQPPFQTFGGDFQRIASYVFGDRAVSKPFERWIEDQLEGMSAEELIESLGDDANEELIIQILAMGRDQW